MIKHLLLASGILVGTAAVVVGCHHDNGDTTMPPSGGQPGALPTGQPDGGTSISDATNPDALTPKNTWDNRNGGGGVK